MFTVKVSGIYTTALTLFLVEKGYKIVKVSDETTSKKSKNKEEIDIEIYDRWNLHGINITGDKAAVNKLMDIIEDEFPESIIRYSDVSFGGIYKTQIIQKNKLRGYTLVALDANSNAIIPEILHRDVGESVLVEIRESDLGGRKPRGTTNVTFSSKYTVLFPGNEVKISRRIHDSDRRVELLKLGNKIRPEDFSLLWRTSSELESDETLIDDLKVLEKRAKKILKESKEVEAPVLLWQGNYTVDVEFPLSVKRKMDRLRRQAVNTIKDHHLFKSSGDAFNLAIDLGERVIDKVPQKKIEAIFKSLSSKYYPRIGDSIKIDHVKLNGHIASLGPAQVIDKNEKLRELTLRRIIHNYSSYNYLGEKKMKGDYAFSYPGAERWYMETKYFNEKNELKGIYVNINTGIEFFPWGVHYVDLCVDVIQRANGEIEIIDLDELDEANSLGYISDKLRKKSLVIAKEQAERLKNEFSNKVE
ncbi:MAG: DUF402 domain-containing protein [Candidatus Ranarchaeia archaeon]